MTNQDQATGPNLYDQNVSLLRGTNFAGISTLQSFWFIKSDHLGKLSVGLQSQASDNTAILPDGSGSLVPANYVFFDYGGFYAGNKKIAGSETIWAQAEGCSDCNGTTTNSVRYDLPTFAGFSVSASWGEDDFWDVAARYAGEWNGIKLAAATAYSEATDDCVIDGAPIQCGRIAQGPGTAFFQVGAYVEHVPTGLFLYGAYGRLSPTMVPLTETRSTASGTPRLVYVSVGRRLVTPCSTASTRTLKSTRHCSMSAPPKMLSRTAIPSLRFSALGIRASRCGVLV